MKTLQRREDALAQPKRQREVLAGAKIPRFSAKLSESELWPLQAIGVDLLQVNLGKLCNQVCQHCHVDAGPDRTEIMARETMTDCLSAITRSDIRKVDLTGGAPEMNPHFRWFVEELRKLGCEVLVRCNLTVIFAAEKYRDLPQFFAGHQIHVVSSLPCYRKTNTDAQRGLGVFEKSIAALRALNAVGYGKGLLRLDLVYNPVGAMLPGPQEGLEADYKRELGALYGIEFDRLVAITNLPVSRFLEFLIQHHQFESYMASLVNAYNPAAAAKVMCRNLISVGWDGQLYDCDFNQMLALGLCAPGQHHIRDFALASLATRQIVTHQHCYGCTAGAGSSCSGQPIKI